MVTRLIHHRLFLNSASIFGGEAVARLATFLVALIVARWYGPEALGDYGYALALASVLMIVPDFGLHLFAVRELASAPQRLPEIFWGVHWIKLVLCGFVALCTLWLHWSGAASGAAGTLLLLLMLRVLFQTCSGASMAVFKAFERMHYIGFQQLLNAAVVFLWVAVSLGVQTGLSTIVMGLVAGQVLETLAGWFIIRRHFTPGYPQLLRWKPLSEIAWGAFPIGVTGVLVALNLRVDILVLRRYADPGAVGYFHAAASVALFTFVATSLLMTVLFPKVSRLIADGSARGGSYVRSLLKNGLLVSGAGSLVIWLLAPSVMSNILGSEFLPAADTLRILTPALPLIVLNTILFYVFVAARRRLVYLGTLVIGITAGMALCFYLVPRYGAAGGAIADVVREAVVSTLYLYSLARGRHARAAGRELLKVLAGATGVLIAAAYITGPLLTQVWLAAWTLLVLAGTVLLLGLPRVRELRLLTDNSL